MRPDAAWTGGRHAYGHLVSSLAVLVGLLVSLPCTTPLLPPPPVKIRTAADTSGRVEGFAGPLAAFDAPNSPRSNTQGMSMPSSTAGSAEDSPLQWLLAARRIYYDGLA